MDVGQAITEAMRQQRARDELRHPVHLSPTRREAVNRLFATGGVVPGAGCTVWTEAGERIVPLRRLR